MGRFDFFKRTYAEDTVLERVQKLVKQDEVLQRVVEILYFHPQAANEDIAREVSKLHIAVKDASGAVTRQPVVVDVNDVKLRLRPQAMRLIERERARNTPDTPIDEKTDKIPSSASSHPKESVTDSIDDMEEEAVTFVNKAQSEIGIQHYLHKVIIFLFKTFAPLTVLALTIPESLYVFTHIYTHPDDTLRILTGIFAVLVDFGYLYLTVLLAMNKEALFKRQRAGIEIEPHERKAVRVQSVLWWCVALMDMLAQAVFLYGATQDSTFFAHSLVLALVAVRIVSLFLTMFVVSFAGTELMTSVDKITNEQVERAHNIGKVLAATGEARLKRQQARMKLEEAIELQNLQREGNKLLSEIYADARNSVRQQRQLKPTATDTPPKSIK